MNTDNKNKFIAESAAKNLAAMFGVGEGTNPDPMTAIQASIQLWDELIKQGIVSEQD